MSKEGLKMHYYENKKNLVIFIHGLFGSKSTWENKNEEYLTDILYSQPEIRGNFDLGNLNYKSKIIKKYFLLKKDQLTIKELSKMLETEINVIGKKYENIILIGHSMGGIIAKQYILDNIENNKVKLYISIATPHLGSNMANFIKIYKHPQIKELVKNNNYLVDLNRDWRSKKNKLPKSYYLYGLYDKVVSKKSAIPDNAVDNNYIMGFPEDHSSIVKLEDNSTLFKYLIQILDEFYLNTNPEKVLFLNSSKKIINIEASLTKYIEKGYQVVDTFPEKDRNNIFDVNGVMTTTLKDKELFEIYLDKYMKNLNIYLKGTTNIIYTGIPLVPLTFLEGYSLRTIKDIKYLVNYRNHKENRVEELKYGQCNDDLFQVDSLDLIGLNCSEVSINLSSSFDISNEPILNAKSSPILNYKRNPIEFDHITHYSQVQKIADNFVSYIRELKSEKNVQRINIFAAIPVPLSYEIARKIENHDPDIYIYQYEKNKYEWGLNIKTGELEIL